MKHIIKLYLAKLLYKPVAWLFAELAEEVYETKIKCFYCNRPYGKHDNS